MKTFTVPTYETRCVGETEIYAVHDKDNGRYILAEQYAPDMSIKDIDVCGVTILEESTFNRIKAVKHCCNFCDSDNSDRVINAVECDQGNSDTLEILTKLQKRGVPIAQIVMCRYGMGEATTELRDSSGYFVVAEYEGATIESALTIAQWLLAVSTYPWQVGTCPENEYIEGETTVSDCLDLVGGVVWDNVDFDGENYPTEAELLAEGNAFFGSN